MVIRFHSRGKLLPDDFVLMFACSTFIASQSLLYILKIEDIYFVGGLAFESMSPQNLALILEDPQAFDRRVFKIQRIEFSSLTLTFTSIFAVKICFLLFFYEMITRLRRFILAWKVILELLYFSGLCAHVQFLSVVSALAQMLVSQRCFPNPILLFIDYST